VTNDIEKRVEPPPNHAQGPKISRAAFLQDQNNQNTKYLLQAATNLEFEGQKKTNLKNLCLLPNQLQKKQPRATL